jgi:hypothetical protein
MAKAAGHSQFVKQATGKKITAKATYENYNNGLSIICFLRRKV